MAGPNKTYPAILGMVGLSLHLSNEIAVRDYEKRALEAIQRGALDYSLVSKAMRMANGCKVCLSIILIAI